MKILLKHYKLLIAIFSIFLVFAGVVTIINSGVARLAINNISAGKDFSQAGFDSSGISEKNKETKILFVGDLMLDREVRRLVDKKGAPWLTEKVERMFLGQDINIANLEGAITDRQSVSLGATEKAGAHFLFTFDPDDAKTFLFQNKINVVNLGNNHSLNFGADGISKTKEYLKEMGMEYFGDPTDENNILIKDINGKKIAFVSYNQFSKIASETTIEKIRSARKENDIIIVYAHWGVEYQLGENKNQEKLAHSFIDAGADVIIGSHPHVVQPLEIYREKAIFYSLGNFIFDQSFTEDVRTRLAVSVAISDEGIDFSLFPLYLEKNGQLASADAEKSRQLLERLAGDSTADNDIKEEIRTGRFVLERK